MLVFRTVLGLMFSVVLLYTAVVGSTQGWNLISIFFGDIAALNWPGQFNLDFSCLLIISGIWLAWRNHFSPLGLALGVLASVAGTLVLAPYLLWASIEAKGNVRILLLGAVRAGS